MRMLSEEQIDELATNEVLDETRDVINGFELGLQEARSGGDPTEVLARLRRDAFSLRTKSLGVAIPGLAPMIQRLDEYVGNVKALDEQAIDDLQAYVDRIAALLEGEEVVAFEDIKRVVREMPHMPAFDVNDIEIHDVEVMVVMPQNSAARVVQRELAACGYRATVATNPLEAIGLIVETKPDLVITAMVMPRLSGADLCCALAAMPSTKDIPVAVLTSLELDDPALSELPMTAGRMRRGKAFGDDLADVLSRFKIT